MTKELPAAVGSPSPSAGSGPELRVGAGRRLVRSTALLAVAAVSAVGMYSNFGGWRLFSAVLLSAALALCVGLVPSRWRLRLGGVSAAFVAVLGVLPILFPSPDQSRVDTRALADLAQRGPFTEPLPRGLTIHGNGIKSVRYVRLPPSVVAAFGIDFVDGDLGLDSGCGAVMEVFPDREAASQRKTSAFESYWEQQPQSSGGRPALADDESFTVTLRTTSADGYTAKRLVVGANRGYVYTEAWCPGIHANFGRPQGVANAVLRYGDRLTKLATRS